MSTEITKSVYSSVDELAGELNLNRASIYAALKRNEIPHRKIGRRYILPKSAITEWLRNTPQGGSNAA